MDRRTLLRAAASLAGLAGVSGLASAADCSSVPAWDATTLYATGDRVSHPDTDGVDALWEAALDSRNAEPSRASAYWDYVGDCDGSGGGGGNTAPTASASASPTTVTTGETVSFDGSGSSDSDGSISSYDWDFGDGATGTGQTTSHSYASTGTYTATLTVTDDGGATATDSVSITVESEDTGGGGGGGDDQSPYGQSTPRALPGRIQAQHYDAGGEGVAYHDTTSGNSGGAFRSEDVDIESVSDSTGGSYNVGWITDGEWLEFTVTVDSAGTYDVDFRVASNAGGGTFHLEADGTDVTGTVTAPGTGGWQSWTTVTATDVSLSAGEQVLRFAVETGGFNLNWFDVHSGGDGGDGGSGDTPIERHGQLQVIGTQLCDEAGEPVQLQGMSTHGIQWYGWGDCLTEASLDALADDWQAEILRISLYVQEGGYETDPDGFTQEVNTLVEEATERGMYALVDWHQLDPGDPNENTDLAKQFFNDVVPAHADKDNVLYDVANEPNNVAWSDVRSYAEEMVPVIRQHDPEAVVLCGTHGWASLGVSDGGSAQEIIDDPVDAENFLYTFHFYAASHGQSFRDELSYAADHLPIFVTEWGAQEYTGDGPNDFQSAQQYLDILNEKGISWTNWNYSDDQRSGAAWVQGTCPDGPWTTDNLKESGSWVRERIRNG